MTVYVVTVIERDWSVIHGECTYIWHIYSTREKAESEAEWVKNIISDVISVTVSEHEVDD